MVAAASRRLDSRHSGVSREPLGLRGEVLQWAGAGGGSREPCGPLGGLVAGLGGGG
jgi:hypothetical protein